MNLAMQIFNKKQLVPTEQCQILGNATSDSRGHKASVLLGTMSVDVIVSKRSLLPVAGLPGQRKVTRLYAPKVCIGSQICQIAPRSSSIVDAVCTTEVSCVRRDLPNTSPWTSCSL